MPRLFGPRFVGHSFSVLVSLDNSQLYQIDVATHPFDNVLTSQLKEMDYYS